MWASNVLSPHLCHTVGTLSSPQHPYTPNQGVGHTRASLLRQSQRGQGTKAALGFQPGTFPRAALQHETPLPDPVTFGRLPWGTLHISLPSTGWSRPSNAGNHPKTAASTACIPCHRDTPGLVGSGLHAFERGPQGWAARHPTRAQTPLSPSRPRCDPRRSASERSASPGL